MSMFACIRSNLMAVTTFPLGQESLRKGSRPETDLDSTGNPAVAESKESWGLGNSSVDKKALPQKSEDFGFLEPM